MLNEASFNFLLIFPIESFIRISYILINILLLLVACGSNSTRSLQMLHIINMILPKYMEHIKDYTNKNDLKKCGRDEIKIIEKLSMTMKALIYASDWLTRTFTEPKSDASGDGNMRYSRTSYFSPSVMPDEESTK